METKTCSDCRHALPRMHLPDQFYCTFNPPVVVVVGSANHMKSETTFPEVWKSWRCREWSGIITDEMVTETKEWTDQ